MKNTNFSSDKTKNRKKNNSEGQKKKCVVCGFSLRAIGDARKNGAPHPDWVARKMHKHCWK